MGLESAAMKAALPHGMAASAPWVSDRPERGRDRRRVAAWLFVCCALVFAMVVVGGVTRLTHSGLSIVEWQPIVGTVPPLSQSEWEDTFQKYQLTPEYRQVNRGMSLEEFKGIFWWEYGHRLLGRLIGFAFLLPLLAFWLRGSIDRSLAAKLAGIFILGGLQGAMGWYMVKSGLVDDPHVSQYRLTAHLAMAVAIYAAMLWSALEVLRPTARPGTASRLAWAVTFLVAYQIVTGGFVAGIHAGLAYNSFPLMNGHVVPPEIASLDPWYLNLFSNMATVQFDHRLGAWALAVAVPWLWLRSRRYAVSWGARVAIDFLAAALVLQVSLGIATLLLVVPVPLAAAHQAGALVLFTAALCANHALRSSKQSNSPAS